MNKLEAYSTEIMGKLKGISGLMDVESSVADKKPTVDIVMNQQRGTDGREHQRGIGGALGRGHRHQSRHMARTE